MQRKDYQDALNELRLGSSFCEEMEKKLSAERAEADEYTDEVTHVDVISPRRSHKGLAIAAAAVLLIGGAGGTVLYRNKDTFLSTTTNEDSSYYDEKSFAFPFGTVDLHGLVVNYQCDNYMGSAPVTVATEEMGEQLISLFSITDFEKLDTLEPIVKGSGEVMDFHTDYFFADFYDNGIIEIIYIQDDVYREYYKIPEDTFEKMRDIIFKDYDLGSIDQFGIKAELFSAQLRVDDYDGGLSNTEAIALASNINNIQWNERDTDGVKDSSDTITLDFESEGKKYEIILGDNGMASVEADGKMSYYSYAAEEYPYMRRTVDKGVDADCPIKYDENDTWLAVTSVMERRGGAVYIEQEKAVLLDKDEKKEIYDALAGFEWRELLNSAVGGFDIYDTSLNFDSCSIGFWSDGKCMVSDYTAERTYMYLLKKEDYQHIRNLISEAASNYEDDDNVADYCIDHILYEDDSDQFFMLRDNSVTTGLANYTFDTGEKELKKILLDAEWKKDISGISSANTMYPVFKDLRRGILYLTTDGMMIIPDYGLKYRCSDSEKLSAYLKEMRKNAAETENTEKEEKTDNTENSEE